MKYWLLIFALHNGEPVYHHSVQPSLEACLASKELAEGNRWLDKKDPANAEIDAYCIPFEKEE